MGDTLRVAFCKKFSVSPCSPVEDADDASLHLSDDLVINAPASQFNNVLSFFQQHRIARLNPPATVDLDLAVHANTRNGASADYALSIWAGDPHPVDMHNIYHMHGGKLKSMPKTVSDEDLWAYTCSYDAGGEGIWVDLCGPAAEGNYAFNTTCRADPVGAHLHLYYWNNDKDDASAKTEFEKLASAEFGLSPEICHDNYGHEEPHNATCWLGGPERPQHSLREEGGPPGGGSFVTSHFSIYMVNDDVAKVTGWVLQNDISKTLGKALDYVLHPVFGCNFADHQQFALHKGHTPNNLAGVEESGGWTGSAPPRLDPFGPSTKGATCGCTDPEAAAYDLHLLYDPSDSAAVAAKDQLKAKMSSSFIDAKLIEDVPLSFQDTASPFLGGQVHYQVAEASALIDWLATVRGDLDVMLVPQTCCGSLADYTQHALWAGRRWPLNTAALSSTVRSKRSLRQTRASQAAEHDFVLYAQYVTANKWQVAAAEKFVSAFASQFVVARKGCPSSTLEPSGSELCMMDEVTKLTASDPQTTAYASIFVPRADVSRVLSWALSHRGADAVGYQVDLTMVPLTGEPVSDFNVNAWHVGTEWQINQQALA